MDPASQIKPRRQVMTFETLPKTFDILSPTVRMEAIAATAISEAINVYSTAVAPWSFFIIRRNMDSIRFSRTQNTDGRSPTYNVRHICRERT